MSSDEHHECCPSRCFIRRGRGQEGEGIKGRRCGKGGMREIGAMGEDEERKDGG